MLNPFCWAAYGASGSEANLLVRVLSVSLICVCQMAKDNVGKVLQLSRSRETGHQVLTS